MGIGAILSIIFSLIGNLPTIISIVMSIIKLISGIKDPGIKATALSDLKDAYRHAHETGDASMLNELHDDLCKNGGVGCPTDIKKS